MILQIIYFVQNCCHDPSDSKHAKQLHEFTPILIRLICEICGKKHHSINHFNPVICGKKKTFILFDTARKDEVYFE